MEKKYVKLDITNTSNTTLLKKGDLVIVKDGSYMLDYQKTSKYGSDFLKEGLHEVLQIKYVNLPCPTNYDKNQEHLSYQNNCVIEGFDGSTYYCSKINILKYIGKIPQDTTPNDVKSNDVKSDDVKSDNAFNNYLNSPFNKQYTISTDSTKDFCTKEESKQLCWKAYTNHIKTKLPISEALTMVEEFNKWFAAITE